MKTILLISPYWKEEHRWMVSTVKLAELWQKLGYRVIVACMGGKRSKERKNESMKGQKIEAEVVSDTLSIYRKKDLFIPDPWNYGIAFGFTGFVRRIIKNERPDVIVVNKILFWSSFSLILLRLTGKKVILLTDALVGITWWPRSLIPKACAAIYAWTAGWLILLFASKVVTFHPQSEKILKILRINKKVEVIPTGIQSESRNVVRSEGQMTITYVGRLESVKGVDDFLASSVAIKKEYPDIKIQVVGWYKEGHPLVRKYRDEVVFTGLRDDVSEILGNSEIFVLPSYSEGLSNALMEAMSAECACIATEVGGNRYLIQNGVSGLLYPPGDREVLKSHLRKLIEDTAKRKSLGENAHKRIEETFDWKIVGKQYQELFESFTS
ncbi:MAG: glycosyltransferase family 4 protein [Candidatus Peribacteraceae bacterium]|jgi:glycosyltransferase involved in cell wall biosynthesis|nr:glycosyltransferase family 4 protein [Candidatus Peribacteraceae bacterium]MDP7646361.1 glycosyltransferase family 4 protein [Candidatus Peribacteraceae bacterium]|tara:strand:- start:271 stop:1416 length:1146 start_codon:yes stop_codon:yes gene_type:complete